MQLFLPTPLGGTVFVCAALRARLGSPRGRQGRTTPRRAFFDASLVLAVRLTVQPPRTRNNGSYNPTFHALRHYSGRGEMVFRVELSNSKDVLKTLRDANHIVPQADCKFVGPHWRNVANATCCRNASRRHKSLIVLEKGVVCTHARTSQGKQQRQDPKIVRVAGKKCGEGRDEPGQGTLKADVGGKRLHVLVDHSFVERTDWHIIQRVALAVHTEADIALAEVQRRGRQCIPPKLS